MGDKDTSVKVAVRIRPLNSTESAEDSSICVDVVPGEPKIVAGSDMYFTFDHVFGMDSEQEDIYSECVVDLVNSSFEGFNATILAYGQTGSGKTWTMGSSSDLGTTVHTQGIIPRVIRHLFHAIEEKESQNANTSYKVQVSFMEIYGEDIRDLLDTTRTSKVTIREAPNGDVFVAGTREEVVTSVQQMSKTLEDGTKNRTTAATRMNLSSSRSHAIFTVMIEQTIHVGAIAKLESVEAPPAESETEAKPRVQMKQEVRKCKFHFVDLAGSERLKRTGAQGQQMKEGIDINKGLLALGNVISALGDETKRGKVHVPYRDSKLTRILQDSLGGNSKTLMICCVSPAYSNFFESVNALRYANRARNIKNKPVVNRDPTLVIIDELKQINQLLASEVLAASNELGYIPKEPRFSIDYLGNIVGANPNSPLNLTITSPGAFKRMASNKLLAPASNDSSGHASQYSGFSLLNKPVEVVKSAPRNKMQEQELKRQLDAADEEVHRMTQIIRQSHLQIQDLSDRLAFTSGERDFFRMKWIDANPDTVSIDDNYSISSSPASRKNSSSFSTITESAVPIGSGVAPSFIKRELKKERDKTVDMISKYVKEIEDLKRDLNRKQPIAPSPAGRRKMMSPLIKTASENITSMMINQDFDMIEGEEMPDVDTDWTASIARAIAQAKDFIRMESKKLLKQTIAKGKGANNGPQNDSVVEESKIEDPQLEDEDEDEDEDAEDTEANELRFKRRQEDLKAEVIEITESIQVKENLVKQLEKSQHQYSAMKAFYEQKLEALSAEVARKQSERESLLKELNELETKKNLTLANKAERETKLRDELKRRDEELRGLRKKQEDLNRLSKVQSRYLEQLSKLEVDIETMKRHRNELTKTLAQEKKQHLYELKEKAKEIDQLKRQLVKRSEEINRLGNEKEKAMNRAKEMMRENAENRRRTGDFYKLTNGRVTPQSKESVIDKKSIVKSAPMSSKRVLNQAELRTKKWLEKQIVEINAREEAAEALRRQCEQQMALIKERENLETIKDKLMTKSISSLVNGSISNPKMDAMSTLLGTNSDESLTEIEDKIAAVDSQLKLRTRQISDIRDQLANDSKTNGSGDQVSGAMESLKRTAAQSLPAAHELIRLIFDMLVDSRRETVNAQTLTDDGMKREKKFKEDISRLEREMQGLKHNHEVDLMRVAQEYEEKLQGLFDHSSIGQMLLQEGATVPNDMKMSDEELQEALRHASQPKDATNAKKGLNGSPTGNETQLRALISLSLQQIDSLRHQISHERSRSEDLESNISSLENYRTQLARVIDDRDANIKFLEEERNFFKDMVYDLRAHVEKLGGKTGKRIIRHIRNRAKSKKEFSNGGNEVVLGVSDDEDDGNGLVPLANLSDGDINDFDNEDSKSVQDQYEEIDNEIKNSKSVHMKGNVVARLTNPSNFTGVHKKVFEEDLSTKRKKVQEMKNHVGTSIPAFNAASAGGIVPVGSSSNRPPAYSIKKSSMNSVHTPDGSIGLNPNDLLGLSGVNNSASTKDINSPPKRGSATPTSDVTSSGRMVNGKITQRRASGELGTLSVKNVSRLGRAGSLTRRTEGSETSSLISREDINVKDIDDERSSMETMPDDAGSGVRQ